MTEKARKGTSRLSEAHTHFRPEAGKGRTADSTVFLHNSRHSKRTISTKGTGKARKAAGKHPGGGWGTIPWYSPWQLRDFPGLKTGLVTSLWLSPYKSRTKTVIPKLTASRQPDPGTLFDFLLYYMRPGLWQSPWCHCICHRDWKHTYILFLYLIITLIYYI